MEEIVWVVVSQDVLDGWVSKFDELELVYLRVDVFSVKNDLRVLENLVLD